MKNLKSLFAAAALTLAIAGTSHAQNANANPNAFNNAGGNNAGGNNAGGIAIPEPLPIPNPGDRVAFNFSPNGLTSDGGNGVNTTQVTIGSGMNTTVIVRPFLLARAQLGGTWTVDGWGSDTISSIDDAGLNTQTLDVWHSEKVRLTGTRWGNPAKVGDTSRTIPMTFTNVLKNALGAQIGGTTTPVDVTALNGPYEFAPDVTVGGTAPTLGHLRADYVFFLSPNPTTTAGTYTLSPTLTFTNQ
jgi:hypothetical protein